ncbi:MAG: hypothetical protein ABIR62_15115 [Dokdonella sp.]|uniref:hypothetical protein n=1 Tax=Dokdonella sp. TaxID=2291710 RepID=UPI003265A2CF
MASVREVKQQVEDGGEEIAQTARDGADATAGEMHRLRSKLRSNGAQLEDDLRDAGERFTEGAKKFGEAAAEQVREHPMAAFGIAFAAGIVVSRWLRSR